MSAAERIGTFVPGSPEWHAARAGGIGASEIAAVVGLSPWESHFGLWHRKAGLIGPQPGNDLTTWGQYLEEPIARRFADAQPELRVRRTGTWRSKMRPWQLANPDRLAYAKPAYQHYGDRWPVEVKWSPHADGWGPSGSDEIPVYYRSQVLWQMDVLGADRAFVAALVGSEYREYAVPYDPADVEVLREAGQRFMDSLAAGVPPDLDETSHTYQVLRELHPDIDGDDADVDQDVADGYRQAKAGLRDAEALSQYETNRLLDAMGNARYAVDPHGERVARRQPARGGRVALYEVKPRKEHQTIREAIA